MKSARSNRANMNSRSVQPPTPLGMHASTNRILESPLFLQNDELRPSAPFNIRWRIRDPLPGYQVYLVEQVRCLNFDRRQLLLHILHRVGWPLHLRSMNTAALKIQPESQWSSHDENVLKLLRLHFAIPNPTVVAVFFEGRTEEECERKLVQLTMNVPNDRTHSRQPEIGEESMEVGTTSESEPGPFTDSGHFCEEQESKPVIEPTSEKVGLAGDDRPPSETIRNDEYRRWESADRHLLFSASQEGMTGREIQQKYFPYRTVEAVQKRASMEKKARDRQLTPKTRWNSKDYDLFVELVKKGHSVEDISSKFLAHKSVHQCKGYYQHVVKKLNAPDRSNVNTSEGIQANRNQVQSSRMSVGSGGLGEATARRVGAAASSGDMGDITELSKIPSPEGTKAIESNIESQGKNSSYGKEELTMKAHREALLSSIGTYHLTPSAKARLKKALDKNGWPKRFTSLTEFNSPLPRLGSPWLPEDLHALNHIRNAVSGLPFKVIAEKFFPGRTENGARNQFGSMRRSGKLEEKAV